MRDAIGQVFALQVILIFVMLINGYMAYSVNYSRAFRVKNQIVNIIEEYEGTKNERAIDEINEYIAKMSYDVDNQQMIDFENNYTNMKNIPSSNVTDVDCPGYTGWCYIEHTVTQTGADEDKQGVYYTIVTFVNIDIPVVKNILGLGSFLQVVGETRTIY